MSIRYLKSHPHVSRGSFSEKILTQIRREFGAEVEPFTLHLPVPELLAGVWMACRETLLAGNGVRDAKEIIATAVSMLNQCPYCVDAHSMMLLGASGDDFSRALQKPELSPFAAWGAATRTPSSPILATPPFSADEAPAFIGTAVVFHYINRMVTILLGTSPLPFTKGLPKMVAMRMAAWFFGKAVNRPKQPGTSIDLLPEAPLPEDLLWAKPSPSIAEAFARFAQVVENAGTLALPQEVRTIVNHAVQEWQGNDQELDNRWCEEAIACLDDANKCAGRLALLTALAPWRVSETIVRDFSSYFAGDNLLVSALAWSSFSAARKIGTWLTLPDPATRP
ncbi:MAG: alkylhydroperoxidase [Chlorobium sp.]|nr:MAG: alkylhydroperoxidase [Chlorobium sp.]